MRRLVGWAPIALIAVVVLIAVRKVAIVLVVVVWRRAVAVLHGGFGELVDGVDTPAGHDCCLDQAHVDDDFKLMVGKCDVEKVFW